MDETLTLIEKTAFLKSLPTLTKIPTEALAELAARAREVHCEPGHVLYREGDPDRGNYVVVEGLLELRRGPALVRALTRGMSVGELWLAEGEPHRYTLVASNHAHVLNVTREDTIDAMIDHPEFAVAMVRFMGLRIHEQTGRVLELEGLLARLYDTLRAAGIPPPADPEP